ncbi:MAG: YggT family protein [Propionibacteriaceae bacterium]|jgi:YggT family protein|nr:YggT family protein [Propionibacteriaceae bacterium]
MSTIGLALLWIIRVYFWVLMARAIVSWLPLLFDGFHPKGPALVLVEAIYTVTDPPLKWLQRWIRPLVIGGMGIDLAFIVLLVLLMMLQRVIIFVFWW